MRTEILRALRLIGERKAVLAGDGSLRLASPAGEDVRLAAAEVMRLVSEGLLERRRDAVWRGDAGRGMLRRALSAGEDAYGAQHRATAVRSVEHEGARRDVAVNLGESPLAWLATRRDGNGRPMITPAEAEAGRRLAEDHARGHHQPRVTQSWDASGVRGEPRRDGLSAGEAAEDARRRLETALKAVGPDLDRVLLAVCCEEVGLGDVEKRMGWPQRSGKVVLRLALARLAAHYGLADETAGTERAATVHWGAPGYRPTA
ncbi:DUF6456 domain-containing protein [Acuticoccus mangrovi]|uniref:DUF6456 domain-containing protein n=1 Tax=Acuticoccus mangrovi TaxID=2796142 RepID=A0A934MBT5_9HYPH|nr:DUF6456 domain-containing protein [Acuticoccus mangrovi]MBJ3774492.1 hypothetical protein [Acuticoccus mangrovi]